ncbi:EF-P 5-aminopentanol modification-associated protein YfmH [Alicyclobacillus sp. SO9]|uniref:EF-P 5-aminopentanol modification-associated protein YfmH n=1 Tax=Alicyclobacillus sp. SO9 TaxID=2665646 RepID=UPI0018E8D22C|nr:pitrilysin family protein [Alicyclobacillus sp. SO9]QQE80352.1 insulinase family protein [Alicyclobacillus sp. SO9]
MHEITYPPFNEKMYQEQLDNGLTVFLLPKPGFQQTFSVFTTRFGSIDQTFEMNDGKDLLTVPDGIAHFLEHKMFESQEIDVFQEFARHGASANAFTTFDQTSYLFTSTQDILENTTILLDYVQDPYFTEENVEKEKGIIGQEIRMYEDNPDWQSFFGLLKAMYKTHPVHLDIAGTVESIAGITKDLLYDCYRTFYHPANMVYVAVGGFDPEQMMNHIRSNQAAKNFPKAPPFTRVPVDEQKEVATPQVTAELSVSQPRCIIGWKDADVGLTGESLLKQELLTGVILDTLFGRGSDAYHEFIDEELIDQQFSWEYECTESYGYSLVGGNTSNPDLLLRRINETLDRARYSGLSQDEFERNRKKAMGRFAMAMDSPTAIARNFTSYHLKGVDWFSSIQILENLTLEQANERLNSHFVSSQQAASIVTPKE